ncbi:hypothetical protein [Breznakia pachnodae]|uniref:Uncharacterized protein n=1 Tax=Breznakia pachnodae TaxID=265178 RepID=A0ABU0E407_9FIRM|nr:hypothetical protein [Breznakia pachnodae]MDQ0361629.1 hypothetical protein [Breznakia pachnodae]
MEYVKQRVKILQFTVFAFIILLTLQMVLDGDILFTGLLAIFVMLFQVAMEINAIHRLMVEKSIKENLSKENYERGNC